MTGRTREAILADLDAVNDEINKAYWAFTRQARAQPPAMTVPDAYARRRMLREELRALGGKP